MRRRVYIETYGCALNQGDTRIMQAVLVSRGHMIVNSIDEADVVIINTCTVRYDTEQRMLKRIRYFYSRHRDKKLVVAGCMAKAQPYLVAKTAPRASLVSPQNASRIWLAVESPGRVVLLDGERDTRRIGVWVDGGIASIPIQEGCLGNCSFCIVRLARRRLVSYPIEVVVDAVRNAVRRGAVEIQLAGQDTASYGIDIYGEPALTRLLREVSRVPGNYMVRIGMMNPDTLIPILDEIIEILRSSDKIYRFLHIPLQSGSNRVLRIMRRKYTVEEYIEIVERLRKEVPGIAVATDIIVGHPGETEEDFEETIRIIRKLEFDRVHVAGYTIRPNTASASMEQIPSRVKKMRLKRIMDTIEEVGLRRHMIYVGKTVEAYVTEIGRGTTARLRNYTPVVIPGRYKLGEWISTRIVSATFFDLRGAPVG